MSQSEGEAGQDPDRDFAGQLRGELNRRIVELASGPEVALPLTTRDWLATIALFIVLPGLLVWALR